MLFRSFVLVFFCSILSSYEGWTHLELGAGNYGADGHTKTSQAMTVLMKITDVSDDPNYIDELEEFGAGDYNPEEQYAVLFNTLDQLICRFGDVGIFHVNDLYPEYAYFATEKLQTYASSRGYHSITIEAVPGDYATLDSKQLLSRYGKQKYQSVHLKNPEVSFYNDKLEGDLISASDTSRAKTRELLQHLANLSDEGLFLFILDHPNFIPAAEKMEFIDRGIFYLPTETWMPVPYIFPEGGEIPIEYGKVLFIQRS